MTLLWCMATMVRLMGTSTSVTVLWRSAIVKRCLGLLLRWLTVEVWHAIWIRRSSLGLVVMALVVVRMTVLTASRLRNVWHNLHPPWYHTSWTPTSSGVGRSCRAAEPFGELFHKRTSNVVRSDVNGIGNAQNDQRAFRRQWQTRLRGIEAGSRSFLNFPNTNPRFADDGPDQDMRYQKTEWIRLRLRCRRRFKRLIVECTNNQTESLLAN